MERLVVYQRGERSAAVSLRHQKDALKEEEEELESSCRDAVEQVVATAALGKEQSLAAAAAVAVFVLYLREKAAAELLAL